MFPALPKPDPSLFPAAKEPPINSGPSKAPRVAFRRPEQVRITPEEKVLQRLRCTLNNGVIIIEDASQGNIERAKRIPAVFKVSSQFGSGRLTNVRLPGPTQAASGTPAHPKPASDWYMKPISELTKGPKKTS